MTAGLTSVVVAAHQADRFIAEAIDSVLRDPAFGRGLELCVVDDGSTDRTAEIVSGYGAAVRLIRQPNGGAAAARNAGVAAGDGEFIAFLDADDRWVTGRAGAQIEALAAAGPDAGVCFGHEVRFGRATGPPRPARTSNTALIRRVAWARVGPLASNWRAGEFLDWLARARDAGVGELLIPATVVERRVHAANLTSSDPDALRDYARILKRSLDRRRGGSGA